MYICYGRKQKGLGAYTTSQIQSMIQTSAQQYGVNPNLALAIAAHESNFNPTATHSNPNGTMDWGVMQLNDTTVQTLGVQNPLDPQQNINAGMQLLSQLQTRYGGNTNDILWAYMAGPGSVSSGNMPSGVQPFIDWVNNYMGVSPDQTAPTDSTFSFDTASLGLDFSQMDPMTLALWIGGGLLVAVLFSR